MQNLYPKIRGAQKSRSYSSLGRVERGACKVFRQIVSLPGGCFGALTATATGSASGCFVSSTTLAGGSSVRPELAEAVSKVVHICGGGKQSVKTTVFRAVIPSFLPLKLIRWRKDAGSSHRQRSTGLFTQAGPTPVVRTSRKLACEWPDLP